MDNDQSKYRWGCDAATLWNTVIMSASIEETKWYRKSASLGRPVLCYPVVELCDDLLRLTPLLCGGMISPVHVVVLRLTPSDQIFPLQSVIECVVMAFCCTQLGAVSFNASMFECCGSTCISWFFGHGGSTRVGSMPGSGMRTCRTTQTLDPQEPMPLGRHVRIRDKGAVQSVRSKVQGI